MANSIYASQQTLEQLGPVTHSTLDLLIRHNSNRRSVVHRFIVAI